MSTDYSAVMLGVFKRFQNVTMVRVFREDEVLRWSFLLAFALSCLPMGFTSMLPLTDLGSHLGFAGLLNDILTPGTAPSGWYAINPVPVPYWPAYLVINLVEMIAGIFVAGKVIVALTLAGIPLGVMRLLVALERSPRLGLVAFLLVWDINLYWGWVTFQFSMPFVLWAFAWLVEAKTFRAALAVCALSAVVGLSHPLAVMWLVAGAFALIPVTEQPLRAALRTVVALSGLCVLVPWLLARVLFPAGGAKAVPMTFSSPNFEERLSSFFDYSIGVFTERPAVVASALTLILLLVVPMLLSVLERLPVSGRSSLKAIALLTATSGLYFLLPYEIYGNVVHFWTFPRFSTWILAMTLVVPAPALTNRRMFALVPAAVALLALTGFRVEQFRAYGDHVKPYLEIMAEIPKDSRVAPIDVDFYLPGFRQRTLGQLHGYLAAERRAYDPHLFDFSASPVVYRKEGRPPDPDFHHPENFKLETVGRYYDYVVLHPSTNLTLEPLVGNGLELLKVAGAWRLYKVTAPQPR